MLGVEMIQWYKLCVCHGSNEFLINSFDAPTHIRHLDNIDGLVKDCGISSALAMEILQSCTKIDIHVMM